MIQIRNVPALKYLDHGLGMTCKRSVDGLQMTCPRCENIGKPGYQRENASKKRDDYSVDLAKHPGLVAGVENYWMGVLEL